MIQPNIMNLTTLIFLISLIFINHVKSQTLSDNKNTDRGQGGGGGGGGSSRDSVSNFQPSLAVVIGMLSIMFSLTFILIIYAKFCHQTSSLQNTADRIQNGLLRARDQPKGVDKTVVESLPFFRFSSLKGSKEGLDCAVCLAKFEDIEVLRLLPKCKHAFHIDCIDQWLEKHSTCPLCREIVSAEDISQTPYSNSLRWNQSELLTRDESNLELYVQREENINSRLNGSSRFSIGSSFRKMSKKEDELPIRQEQRSRIGNILHKLNHKIVVSDVVLKNRWSNVSSSDLMFLNSEMLNDMSSARFSNLDSRENENKFKVVSENDDGSLKKVNFPVGEVCRSYESKFVNANDKRSMSEIVVHPRFRTRDGDGSGSSDVREERRRGLFLPIAKKTVEWFANRESRGPPLHTQDQFNV